MFESNATEKTVDLDYVGVYLGFLSDFTLDYEKLCVRIRDYAKNTVGIRTINVAAKKSNEARKYRRGHVRTQRSVVDLW